MDTAASKDHQNSRSSANHNDPWQRLLSPTSAATWPSLRSRALAGRRVLITGASGSIGSALVQAAAASIPASLILFDNSENGLYQVDRSLREAGSQQHVSILGSVCNADAIEHTLSEHSPEVIFHAAALKHVPLMELNPFAAIETNVFGTLSLLDAAVAHSVEQVVLVSTDKAVDPRSIMGASKRIAELLLLTADTSTRTTVVRLCNVMGSQGSVLPLFLEQIAKGGPVTVTHPEVQRYFISLHQAVAAIFLSLEVRSAHGLLLPEVGPAVRIIDLARHLLESNRSSAAIQFTGLRPGDKLIEQLISSRELLSPSSKSSSLRAIETPLPTAATLRTALQTLREAIHRRDLQLLLRGVAALVPEYQPSSVITAALPHEPALEPASEILA